MNEVTLGNGADTPRDGAKQFTNSWLEMSSTLPLQVQQTFRSAYIIAKHRTVTRPLSATKIASQTFGLGAMSRRLCVSACCATIWSEERLRLHIRHVSYSQS
jgi:hypothetical protein